MGQECSQPQHALIIKEIIVEDRIRRVKKNFGTVKQKIYNLNSVRKIQRNMKNYLGKKRFYEKFKQVQNFMIEQFKHNFLKPMKIIDTATSTLNLDDSEADIDIYNLNQYTNKNVLEIESKVGRYESTQHFQENIEKWRKKLFLMDLPPVYVNRLHNNDIYKGMWNIDKKFHGYGTLIKTDGSKFQGFWVNGILQNYGRFFTKNGDFFEGGFINGIANGYGVYIHADGTQYKGEWVNDQTHGQGEEYFADGSYYKGPFKNGKKNGKGKFVWSDGSTYEGEIADDLLHGNGIYKWADRRVYTGQFTNNNMSGTGTIKYPNGSKYIGEFHDNQRSGNGKYIWNDNKYYEGSWFNGRQHGKGKYYKNGKLIEGIWNFGKLTNHNIVMSSDLNASRMNESFIAHDTIELKNGMRGSIRNGVGHSLVLLKSLKTFT